MCLLERKLMGVKENMISFISCFVQIPAQKFCTHLGMRYSVKIIPYFIGYKSEIFSFQSNPKSLDPSYKMDLDLWDCLGRVKQVL